MWQYVCIVLLLYVVLVGKKHTSLYMFLGCRPSCMSLALGDLPIGLLTKSTVSNQGVIYYSLMQHQPQCFSVGARS